MKRRSWIFLLVPFLLLGAAYLYSIPVNSNFLNYSQDSIISIRLTLLSIGAGFICGLIPLIISLFEGRHKFCINGSSLIISIICLSFVFICIKTNTPFIHPYGEDTFLDLSWDFCALSGVLFASSLCSGEKGSKLFKVNLKQIGTLLVIVISFYIIRTFMNCLYYSVPKFITVEKMNPQFLIISGIREFLVLVLILISGYVVPFDVPIKISNVFKYTRTFAVIFSVISVVLLSGYLVQIPFVLSHANMPVLLTPLRNIYSKVFAVFTVVGFAILVQTGIFLRLYKNHNKQLQMIRKSSERSLV